MKAGLRSNSSRARTRCYQLMLERNPKFWLHRTLISLEAANPCVWSVLGCKSFQNPSSPPLPLKVPVFGVKDTENSRVEGLEGGWGVERREESWGRLRWDVETRKGKCGGSDGM